MALESQAAKQSKGSKDAKESTGDPTKDGKDRREHLAKMAAFHRALGDAPVQVKEYYEKLCAMPKCRH